MTAKMTANQASEVMWREARSDLAELRQKLGTMTASMLALVGGILAWRLLAGPGFQLSRFAVFFSLSVEGVLSYHLRFRRPIVSRALLLLGPTMSLSLALKVIQNPGVPFFAVLVVVANAAINPLLGFAAAILSTIPLCLLAPNELLLPSLALLWLAAAVQWISSRGLYTVLEWAWSSQQRASHLLEELRDHHGELNRTVEALTEATRRLQRTGYQLAVARIRAEEARELKERFAANISHELRTPLNIILGFGEMMYLAPDVYGDMDWPVTLRRDVRQIYQSSRQLLGLVNDVLDLSRIDAAQMPIHKERSALGAIIQEAVSTVSDLLRARDLELIADLPNTLPLLHFDRTRVRQVLLNLLSNAARFTERGSITVSVEVAEQKEVIVSVADTGVGVPAAELTRIFDEFHQVDMSLRRRQEGAGLGLAISKRFVELHGGRIWAESEPGKGSTFFFSLPLAAGAAAGRLVQAKPLHPSRRSYEPAIVVVDRDPAVGTLLTRYLEGYRILQAEDLQEAQEAILRWHPKALVVNAPPDAHAQQEAYRQALRVVPPKVPVLLCSIPSQSWVTLAMGVRGCLTKPLTREKLLECLSGFEGARDVLVIDDDRGFVQLVVRYLASTNGAYTVRWAYEGEEALAQIRGKRPDLLLLDLVMPGMDGFELLDVLRSDQTLRNIPVLIVTATDYGADMLSQQEGLISVARRQGFSATEVIKYLRAMLDVAEPDYPPNSETETPTAESG